MIRGSTMVCVCVCVCVCGNTMVYVCVCVVVLWCVYVCNYTHQTIGAAAFTLCSAVGHIRKHN